MKVPDPAYFAIHKLAISQRRQAAFAVKVKKDIDQAAQLINVLAELQPGNLFPAHETARQYHKTFFELYQKAVLLLPKLQQEQLKSIISEYSG